MADVKLKFNAETEEVELLIGDRVAAKVETEIFETWVAVYNEKHGYVKAEEKPVETETATEVVETTTETESE